MRLEAIVGAGRVGTALAQLGAGPVVRRGEPLPEGTGPIYVCTRNDDLEGVIASTPEDRRADLVFLQNGMFLDLLARHGLQDNTVALVYFAVSKVGDTPVDGGRTVVTGHWAQAFADRLAEGGLACRVVSRTELGRELVEKLLWNCVFGLLCQVHGQTVGEICARHRDQVSDLVRELAPLAEAALELELEDGVVERLCDYSATIADYRGAVKELPWRNGWFLEQARTPLHVRLLEQASAL
jgi:ketopantoate reductase